MKLEDKGQLLFLDLAGKYGCSVFLSWIIAIFAKIFYYIESNSFYFLIFKKSGFITDMQEAGAMTDSYLVGEPLFGKKFRESYYAPVGQADLAFRILHEIQSECEALQKLREEYVAIVYALTEMGINFRIIYAHEDMIDQTSLGACIQGLNCRLVGFPPEFVPPSVIYPRDFATVFPNIILVNSKVVELQVTEAKGHQIISSPYGEGGRVLSRRKTMLVGERLILEKGDSTDPQKEIERIRALGIKVGIIPLLLAQVFSRSKKAEKLICNDHLDRVGCLLEGKDGGLHLVVDPLICTADWQGGGGYPWIPRLPYDSIDLIKRRCESLEIKVHYPKKMQIPYSLNLVQFSDGRVLMTAGDDPVAETVANIVGEGKIHQTPIPIELFPVLCYAGIRCLVTRSPEALFKKA